jgi:hypothetical protein
MSSYFTLVQEFRPEPADSLIDHVVGVLFLCIIASHLTSPGATFSLLSCSQTSQTNMTFGLGEIEVPSFTYDISEVGFPVMSKLEDGNTSTVS